MRSVAPASLTRVGLALLLAVAFAAIDLLAFVHQAGERHVVCVEHGELIHAEDLEEVAAAPAFAVERSRGPMPDHDGATHCRLVTGASDVERGDVASGGSAVPDLTVPVVALRRAVWSRVQDRVLDQAPKTSPPLT